MKNVYRSYSLRAGVRSRVDWGRSLYRHSRWRLNSLLINDYNILVVKKGFFFYLAIQRMFCTLLCSLKWCSTFHCKFISNWFFPFSIGFSSSSLGSSTTPFSTSLAVVVLIHGESYSWGAGHLIDGGMLANKSRMVVVTLNYRLGILGISFSRRFLSFFLSK